MHKMKMDFSFSFKHARALLSCSPKGRFMRAEDSVMWLQALTLSSCRDQSSGLQLARVGVPKTWAGLLLGRRVSGKVGGAAPITPFLAVAAALAQSWQHVWGPWLGLPRPPCASPLPPPAASSTPQRSGPRPP